MALSKERIEQVLPKNIKDAALLEEDDKVVLAALLHSFLISKGAKESGYLVVGNKNLRKLSGIRKNTLMDSLRKLEELELFTSIRGKPRVEGEKAIASEYHFNWNKIFREPLRKKTNEELFSEQLKSLETPLGTPTTITTTTTITTSITTSTPILTSTAIATPNTTTANSDFFKKFKEKVDSELVGDELLEKRAKISTELQQKRLEIGNSVYNRCLGYLNRIYRELSNV